MAKKKLLICGATGFIGRNLVELLSANPAYDVVAVYHNRPSFDCPNVKWVHADLTNADDVHQVLENTDILVQAAATTSGSKDIVTKPMIHVTDNIVMNSLLFRAAHECGAQHVVFFSCTVMYQTSDKALKETDFNPNDEIHPRYFGVGWTKVAIEKQCEFFSRLGTTSYTVIRHSNIYGAHDKFDLEKSHMFGATITKVLSADEGGGIVVWGTGEEARDLLHVDDLTDFVALALEKQSESFGLYNVGYGAAVSVKDLVQQIVSLSGRDLKIEYDLSKPTIKTSLFLDCSKALKDFGWKRSIDIDDGILDTIAWWRDNIPLSKVDSL